MDWLAFAKAAFLGVVEGLTEFIPVSSTGHLILIGELIDFSSPGNTFEVLIQLGAVLAIVSVYFARLWTILVTLPTSRESRRFVLGVVVAFLPAAFLGVIAHDFIKGVLFETPVLICVALIVGGILLLVVDRLPLRVRHDDVARYPMRTYLGIGLFQCLALVPGTSRSGATIAGALLMGVDKRSAAEFSFFLAMPTMAGAFVYDLIANRDLLTFDAVGQIVVGFVLAFIAAVLVVRSLLDFVSRHGYAPFAWWRIAVGTLGIILLTLFSDSPSQEVMQGDSGYEEPAVPATP